MLVSTRSRKENFSSRRFEIGRLLMDFPKIVSNWMDWHVGTTLQWKTPRSPERFRKMGRREGIDGSPLDHENLGPSNATGTAVRDSNRVPNAADECSPVVCGAPAMMKDQHT